MKKLFIISLSISIALSTLSYKAMAGDPSGSEKISKNFLKFNLTSAVIKNYSIQYERILSRGISLGVAYKIMPSSGLPYADKMIKWFDITDHDTQVLRGHQYGELYYNAGTPVLFREEKIWKRVLLRTLLQVWTV